MVDILATQYGTDSAGAARGIVPSMADMLAKNADMLATQHETANAEAAQKIIPSQSAFPLGDGQLSDEPYRGLNPYSEAEASFFFGRERDIRTIIKNLKAWHLVILYGESGVGKSSVLRAGVAHSLRQDTTQDMEGNQVPKYAVVVFPSKDVGSWQEEQLLTSLLKQIEIDVQKSGFDIKPPSSELSFVETLQWWSDRVKTQGRGCRLFIILDQFEEYFLYHPQESAEGTFAVEFPKAVNCSELRVNFLISIRADSLAKLDRFKQDIPEWFDHHQCIEHLNWKAAHDAIVLPVEESYNQQVRPEESFKVEPALAENVLDQVSQIVRGNGQGGIEKRKALSDKQIEAPYLQMVMSTLWRKEREANSRTLRLETLNNLGGAEKIVDVYLNEKMNLLPKDQRQKAATVFEYLVTPYGTKIAYPVL